MLARAFEVDRRPSPNCTRNVARAMPAACRRVIGVGASFAMPVVCRLMIGANASLAIVLATSAGGLAGQELPPGEASAAQHLEASPRHGEWVVYDAGTGGTADSVRAWVVHPERADEAPVVVVIHEIYGLTDWIRAVTDQLAAEGFVAIAPDLLSGKAPDGGGSETLESQEAVSLIRELERDEVNRRLRAAGEWAAALPSGTDRVGVVGFCWGGTSSFTLATAWEQLDAAVVYYGTSPETSTLAGVRAPVLGLYGGDDARVNATIEPAREELQRLERHFETEIYEGAGHSFLRQQEGRDGANATASRAAWPRTVEFFRDALER